jgi:GT2 family glycosyltransferase
MITVAVPSWNSLEYLKILYGSLKRNTKIQYEFIVHDNGSTDETEAWLKQNNINYTHSDKNLGFCGVNNALRKAKFDYLLTANSDMYFLPGWDIEILKQINKFKASKIERFTISACLIEPLGNNPEYSIFYCGHDTQSFDENKLLDFYLRNKEKIKRENTVQWSHPILVPKFMMEEIGYWDENYFPGWNVDNDLPKALYEKGCRDFLMLGSSRVFHFISKTFNKLPSEVKNRSGQDVFIKKWGISTDEMRKRLSVAETYRTLKDNLL